MIFKEVGSMSGPDAQRFSVLKDNLEKEGLLELMRKYHTLLAEAYPTRKVRLWEFPSPTEARDFRRPINTRNPTICIESGREGEGVWLSLEISGEIRPKSFLETPRVTVYFGKRQPFSLALCSDVLEEETDRVLAEAIATGLCVDEFDSSNIDTSVFP